VMRLFFARSLLPRLDQHRIRGFEIGHLLLRFGDLDLVFFIFDAQVRNLLVQCRIQVLCFARRLDPLPAGFYLRSQLLVFSNQGRPLTSLCLQNLFFVLFVAVKLILELTL
jgi:hypothetical protein